MSMGKFKAGDQVRVRPPYRNTYIDGSRANLGETLTVTGPNENAVGIGPNLLDYAYHWELEAAT